MAQQEKNSTSDFKLYKAYFNDPTLSDVVIKLSDRSVHAHRIVLCRGSEYFTSLFLGRFRESESKEVELVGDDPEAMVALLRYIYELPYDEALENRDTHLQPHVMVALVAEKYQIEGLQQDVC